MIKKSLDDLKRTAVDADELATLKAIHDDEIDYDNIPPLTDRSNCQFQIIQTSQTTSYTKTRQ
ncbi:MAG: hypothetical protein Q3971_06635 [Moraxella sp.]|nr:hypothetical protein [Moraxella sp.]